MADKEKRFKVIDRRTNEEVKGYTAIVETRAAHAYRRNGIQVNQIALLELATNPRLTKRALRIALWLLADMRRLPAPPKSRQDIAEALSMHKSDVTKGLQELHALKTDPDEHGVFYKPFLPPGPRPLIGVRPSVAWKGKSAELIDAIDQEEKADSRLRLLSGELVQPPDHIARKSMYPPYETIQLIISLEKEKLPVIHKAIQQKYPTNRRPSQSTLQKILDRLIQSKELFIKQQGIGRKPTIYSRQDPSQNNTSRQPKKRSSPQRTKKQP